MVAVVRWLQSGWRSRGSEAGVGEGGSEVGRGAGDQEDREPWGTGFGDRRALAAPRERLAAMPARVEDYEVLHTIGTGSYGRCQKVRRKSDGKVSGAWSSGPCARAPGAGGDLTLTHGDPAEGRVGSPQGCGGSALRSIWSPAAPSLIQVLHRHWGPQEGALAPLPPRESPMRRARRHELKIKK